MYYAQQMKITMHKEPGVSKVLYQIYMLHDDLGQAEYMQHVRTAHVKSHYKEKFCDLISELCEVDVAPDGTMSHGRVIRRYTRMADRYFVDDSRSWDRVSAPAPFDGCICGVWRSVPGPNGAAEWVCDNRERYASGDLGE